jgi:hypothetical protein
LLWRRSFASCQARPLETALGCAAPPPFPVCGPRSATGRTGRDSTGRCWRPLWPTCPDKPSPSTGDMNAMGRAMGHGHVASTHSPVCSPME